MSLALPDDFIVERFREAKRQGVFPNAARLEFCSERTVWHWDAHLEREPLVTMARAGWVIRMRDCTYRFETLQQLETLIERLVKERKVEVR